MWKAIPDWEGWYEASSSGEIRGTRGTVSELAEHFGVSRTTLWNVQNRKRWGWLP